MPTNEKEINCYLLDQLHALKRVRKMAVKHQVSQEVLEAIDDEINDVNEKLYQNPPITSGS